MKIFKETINKGKIIKIKYFAGLKRVNKPHINAFITNDYNDHDFSMRYNRLIQLG